MALPKSAKTRSNVTKMSDARKKRATSVTSSTTAKTKSATRRTAPPDKDMLGAGKTPPLAETAELKPLATQSSDATAKDLAAADDATVVATSPEATPHNAAKLAKDAEKKNTNKAPRVSNRRFDTAKVERIKAQISAGKYQIDYLQVADKFIEHERYS